MLTKSRHARTSPWQRAAIVGHVGLCLAVMAGLASAASHDGRYAVIGWPNRPAAEVYDIVARAGGRLIGTGGLASVVIAQSDAPDFRSRLLAAGAFLVITPLVVGGCRPSL